MNKGCLIGFFALLFILSIGLGYYFYNKSQEDPVVYETAKPTKENIIKKTVATGSIIPRQEVNVKPQVSGVVENLFVEAGQQVKKGQKIARIKLVPSQVNINNAQASVDLSNIRYKEAERELKRQQEVNSRNLGVENAKVAYDNAKTEEQRQKALFEDGVISEQTYNTFLMDVQLKKASFENATISAESVLKQFEAELDIREQELQSAINNLQLLKEGASKKSKQVANVVSSTVDGMILDIPVKIGSSVIERNNFNEGTSIATIADMNTLIFEGKVDESDVGKLKEGMPIELTIGAIEKETFQATLEYIAPKGTVEEGSVKFLVRAAVQSQSGTFLRAGYSANGDIILDRRDSVLVLKERDIIFRNDSTFVEIETGEQQFEERLVKLGLSDGLQIELLDGIDSNTTYKVLTSGKL